MVDGIEVSEQIGIIQQLSQQAPILVILAGAILLIVMWFLKFVTVRDTQFHAAMDKKDDRFVQAIQQIEERIQLLCWDLTSKTTSIIQKNSEILEENIKAFAKYSNGQPKNHDR